MITAVENAANFSKVISPGSLGTIFGANLSPFASQGTLTAGAYPTALGTTDVLFCPTAEVSAQCKPLGLLYTSPNQMNVQFTVGSTAREGFLIPRSSDGLGTPFPITFSPAAPAPFQIGFDCATTLRDPKAFSNCGLASEPFFASVPRAAVTDTSGGLVWSAQPAKLGNWYTLWLTGLSDLNGVTLSIDNGPFTPPPFVGIAPNPGLYQINFFLDSAIVPCGSNRAEINVQIRQGDFSGTLRLPVVTDGKPCKTNMIVFGDSIGAGTGATDPSRSWAQIAAGKANYWLANYALGGNLAADQAEYIYAEKVAGDGSTLYFLQCGANDTGWYSLFPDKEENFRRTFRAESAFLAIPDENKSTGRNGRFRLLGGWQDSPYYTFQIHSPWPGPLGKLSRSPGDSLSAETSAGTVVYLGYTVVDGESGRFRVNIDGIDFGEFDCNGVNGSAVQTRFGRTWAPSLARFAGLPNTKHVVTVTTLRGGVYIDWIAANSPTTGTHVYQISIIPQINGLWDNLQTYDGFLKSDVKLLADDGLPVKYLDIWDQFDAGDFMDGTHPNDAGQLVYANALLRTLKAAQ